MSGPEVRTKWRDRDAGARYGSVRWSSAARRERDPQRIAGLLDRHLARGAAPLPALLLDAPCGAGRLARELGARGRYVGLDVSPPMLAEARRGRLDGAWLAGDVARLPFRSATFDAVVCCRLLHHLSEAPALEAVLRELVRVSRDLVIVSFWDAGSLPAWRRALFGAKPGEKRRTIRRALLAELLARAGADVVGWSHSLRFVARQAVAAARKRPA